VCFIVYKSPADASRFRKSNTSSTCRDRKHVGVNRRHRLTIVLGCTRDHRELVDVKCRIHFAGDSSRSFSYANLVSFLDYFFCRFSTFYILLKVFNGFWWSESRKEEGEEEGMKRHERKKRYEKETVVTNAEIAT